MKKIIITCLLILIGYQFFMKSPKLEYEIQLQNESIHNGSLVLINKQYPIQVDPTNLAEIPTSLASNVAVTDRFLVQQQMLQPLKEMFEAAEADGVLHFNINSAYRSGKLQRQLFETHGAEYALPSGYSEHQTGLSLDIGSTQGTMDLATEGEWLAQNAFKYGFILRYPEDKIDITGIGFEPWHFRYVGLPHSVIMHHEQLVLEEYLEWLKAKETYTEKIDGVHYVVQYIQLSDFATIPETETYKVSGDNICGFIITSE